ncbi:hypothetical protein THAOC_15677 [Thalassiosira oceanica]|uniref:Uncharacterized protein n=1 Tax=Thalassiosira oceanica TaxID=159749 RepID=K0SE78_THAOC|nr:hypothetical protein THAOC_15677 [Thalassiosira oceanica]|mmetsp:Transcript_9447/g.21619  ORF Transcript_9447/g.21619 Transcript_9447/m.21619 type:complete len:324 (+) Transcript_9447:55-1026(+)|eukprot:EJK63650.1 hypothetical protein THAOC_15677 [Thalassiosira oceanica]
MADGSNCKPTLLIGLHSGGEWAGFISDVLINDLLHATTSTFSGTYEDLKSASGDELLSLTKIHGGSVIWNELEVLDQKTGDVDTRRLKELAGEEYHAVVTDDTCFIREPDIRSFVVKQHANGASVVIMGIEGIFDLSVINRSFGLDWKLCAYTARSITLSEKGVDALGKEAFPFKDKYVKSHFIASKDKGEELFVEYLDPRDYDDEEDYPDGIPPPAPGSPVVMNLKGARSVSYFGFVNPLDVPYGPILLKLCHNRSVNNAITNEKRNNVSRQKNGDVETSSNESISQKTLLMIIFLPVSYLLFELFLRAKASTEEDLSGSEL